MANMNPAVRAAAFDLYFSLYKSDGTIIANPGTYTKKISKDGGALADVATAVTEVDTTYGLLKLPLTATEMTADVVYVQVKDDTTGCVPFTTTIYTSAQTFDTIYSKVDTEVASILAAVDTEVAAIKTKTDYLPSATAGATGGVAIVGSAMTLTSAYDAAKTASTQTSVNTLNTLLTLTNQYFKNKMTRSQVGTTVTVTLYNDAGTTPLLTWSYDTTTMTRNKAT